MTKQEYDALPEKEKAEYYEAELCSGCGKEGCDSCPCGTFKVIRKRAALKGDRREG
jgi:hypothetical protein